jgi:LysM repeat protein
MCIRDRQVIVDDDGTSSKTHTVQKGDTLSKIARTYGVQMSVLAKVNNITNVNVIYVGQVLKIPDVTIQ